MRPPKANVRRQPLDLQMERAAAGLSEDESRAIESQEIRGVPWEFCYKVAASLAVVTALIWLGERVTAQWHSLPCP